MTPSSLQGSSGQPSRLGRLAFLFLLTVSVPVAAQQQPIYLPGSGQPLPDPPVVQDTTALPKFPAAKPVREPVPPHVTVQEQRPRRDGGAHTAMPHHNGDGSFRYSFEVGGGGVQAMGGTRRSQTFGGVVEAAAGLNFNKYVALQLRGEYDQSGVPGSVLAKFGQPNGKVQLVSVQANTILHYFAGGRFGGYVTVGGGYFRRVTRFFTSTTGGCAGLLCSSPSTQPTGFFSIDTFGGSGGLGFDWRPSRYSNAKVFLEGRYDYIEGQTPSGTAALYPPNSRNAQVVPVMMGLRW